MFSRFYCILLPFLLSFVRLHCVGFCCWCWQWCCDCWYRWNAAAAAACATHCMAIHPSRISAGAICQLSFAHSDSDDGVLWEGKNKNRKNQKRDWINGMFALIICLNIGSKSTEKPNAPFMCVSLAAVVNCVCVSASMRSRVAASECECVQIKTKPCGTKCAHGDQRHTEQFRIFLLTIACNSDVKNRISLSTIFLFLLQVFFFRWCDAMHTFTERNENYCWLSHEIRYNKWN